MKKRFLILISLVLLVLITLCSCKTNDSTGADSSDVSTDDIQTEANTSADTTPESDTNNSDNGGNESAGGQPQAPAESGTAATFAELKAHVLGRTKNITVTADIIINETLYVTDDVTITATENHTLTRDPAFAGDLFVIGEGANGENPVLLDRIAILTVKPAEGATLTVDGNSANTTVTVAGSAFFLTNSAKLNVYDGTSIINHTKLDNSRLSADTAYFLDHPLRAGGAAAMIADGEFNMYGGTISNCKVNTKDEKNTSEEEQTEGYNNASCGGAVYSHGTFNMYGGTISSCSAARGGAVYNYRSTNIYGGTVSGNTAAVYGGAIYMADSQYSNCVIGNDGTGNPALISENSCESSGGAVFMSHQSTTHVMGNTTFSGNSAGVNGGAINAAGELIVTYAVFTENTAVSKGGAIFAYYSKKDLSPRIARIDGGVFQKNVADRGGAICFADSGDVTRGAIGKIGTVSFTENKAVETDGYGNGGALYLTGKSSVTFIGSPTFTKNSAASGGGAIFVTGASTVDCSSNDITLTFTECSATKNGGAIYAYTDTVLTLPKLVFTDNTAGGNGGAMYVSKAANVTVNGVSTFGKNSAGESGGAAYITSAGLLTFNASSEFTENTSTKTGGAIYVVSENTVLKFNATASFSKNAATTKGGAVYATTGSLTVFNANVTFTENTSKKGGGALYATGATLKHDEGFQNVLLTFSSNSSAGNGGAMYADEAASITLASITATENSSTGSYGGGFIYITGAAVMTVDNLTATGNTALKGGAIYITTTDTSLTVNAGSFSGNTATVDVDDIDVTCAHGGHDDDMCPNGGHTAWSNTAKAKLYIKTANVTFPADSIHGKGPYTAI